MSEHTVSPPRDESLATRAGRRAALSRVGAFVRTESGLARLALGIAALHVVDDNFLQPQPGTSAADHLPGGLVQTAFFVLAAWAYPRLRPGARATLAIWVGLFMAVMGLGEAGYYTRENGPSGDDYTGLLVIPAGLLLVGIGFVTLWRSRKGGSLVRRFLRRTAVGLGLLVGTYLLVYPVAESYVITHAARAYVPEAALGTSYEDVSFTTADGLRLEGWYVPSKNGANVIVFPGSQGASDAGPDPRSPRLRRAALRPTRRGRERRGPERPRLGRDPRSGRGHLVPPGPAGRRRRPHRRARAFGRRRGDASGGCGDRRPEGGRLRGGGHPLRARGGRPDGLRAVGPQSRCSPWSPGRPQSSRATCRHPASRTERRDLGARSSSSTPPPARAARASAGPSTRPRTSPSRSGPRRAATPAPLPRSPRSTSDVWSASSTTTFWRDDD